MLLRPLAPVVEILPVMDAVVWLSYMLHRNMVVTDGSSNFACGAVARSEFLAPNQSLVGNRNNTASAVGANKRKFSGTLAGKQCA
jgi:hypothetical protein